MMKVQKIDTFSGHRDCVYTMIGSGSRSGFYSAGGDGMVIAWDLTKPDLGDLVARVGASVYALVRDPATGNLWIGQNYEGVQVIQPETRKEITSVRLTSAAIFDMLIHEKNAYLAFGDGVIGVVDVETVAVRKHVRTSRQSTRTLALNPAAGHLAAGFSDWNVRIFDAESMEPVHNLASHGNSVFTVTYSPDGNLLFTAGRDARLKVWDVTNGYQLVADIVAHMYAINHVVFSPDHTLFATCSMDKSIKVWDAKSLQLRKVIDRSRHAGHGTSVNKLLWSAYNNYLLSCSDDRMVSVWQLEV